MTQDQTHRRGLLVVDHGTRSKDANAQLESLARALSSERPDWLIEHAHMELAKPDFDMGIDHLVERGATAILIHLHFLVEGYHVRETIPELVERARARHHTIQIDTTRPLGEDVRLVDIVLDRMDAQSARDRQSSKA